MEVCGKTVWISAWSYHGDVCFIPFLAHWLIPPAFLPPPLLPSSPNTRSPLEHRQAPRPALSLARQYVSEFGYPKWCHRGSPGLATLCLSEPGGASHHVPPRRVCKTVMLDLLLKLLFLSHSPPHSSKWQQCQKLVSSFHLQIQQITKHSEGCYCAHLTFSSLTNLPQAKMQSPKMERIGRKVKSRKQCQDYIQGWQLLRLWPWSSAGYHTQTWKKRTCTQSVPETIQQTHLLSLSMQHRIHFHFCSSLLYKTTSYLPAIPLFQQNFPCHWVIFFMPLLSKQSIFSPLLLITFSWCSLHCLFLNLWSYLYICSFESWAILCLPLWIA